MAARPPRILVTRPEPGASRTAATLAGFGFEPVVLPLTEARPVAVAGSVRRAALACGAVAATSARAIVLAPPALIAGLAGKPLFAVGDATAAAARRAGFAAVRSADGDAGALAARLADATPPKVAIAYLCGRIRTGTLEDQLDAAGRAFVIAETYKMEEVSQLADKIGTVARDGPVDAVLFHSGLSACLFRDAFGAVGMPEVFEKTVFFAIAPRAAEPLARWPDARIVAAAAPREDALLAAVRDHFAAR